MSKEINFICGLAGFVGLITCRLLGPGQLISKDFVELSNMHYIYIIIMHFMHHTVCMCVVCMYICHI